MASGVDYAWSHPSPASLKAAKVTFACRYLATDKTKSLTAAEAKALAAVGIWSVVVWESTATRMTAGKAAGAADAKTAQAQATAAGMPADRPIYFAADWDATEAQQAQINAYLDGAASVLGADRVGIYGGYYPVKRALDAGKATWAWQTIAWSGGQWDSRAHIRQGAQKTIGGVSCDLNTSMQADYGQWMPGKTPPEDDVALTTDDINKVAAAVVAKLVAGGGVLETSDLTAVTKAVLNTDGLIAAPADAPDIATNPYWALQSYIKDTNARVRAVQALLGALNGQQIAADAATALGGYELTLTKKES